MTISITVSKRVWKEDLAILPKKLFEKMVRNQVRVRSTNSLPSQISNSMIKWCNQNCNKLFYYTETLFYFEEAEDMLAFKLAWEGKDEYDE